MYRHPHVAAVMQNKKSARHRHKKHEDGDHRDGDSRRKSPRRNRLPAPLSVEITIVPVIAAIWRPSPAPTAAAGILDNEFDFRRCNCARHDDFPAPLPFTSLVCLGHAVRGNVLRNKIFDYAGHAKFIRTAINARLAIATIVLWRR